MQAKAVAKQIRIAPRKARLVIDLIRGKRLAKPLLSLRLRQKLLHRSLKKF